MGEVRRIACIFCVLKEPASESVPLSVQLKWKGRAVWFEG